MLDNSNSPVQRLTTIIDALFFQGIAFNSWYCAVGICRPSLASMFTGLKPVQSGALGNTLRCEVLRLYEVMF